MEYSMALTFSLVGVAVVITAVVAMTFFWPMSVVHLRDRHPQVHVRLGGIGMVAPSTLFWLLAGRYHALHDPGLNGLATPARIALFGALFGASNALGFGFAAWMLKP
ncbi:MAG: hypothetical protein JSR34_04805 [Proteobacteria bacterium]|nr:hypothetical protein [Pseudomonadota bacterium]